MEILRFTLSGKNACFRKPEVNSYGYFSYGNIHKVALLGLFGAVLGYNGYNQMQDFAKTKKKTELTQSYPEFYEKLKNVKLSILPEKEGKGFISKKIQIFNNSVGYASKEQGGNLVVKEQWLENPCWEICVLIDSEEAEKIREAICNHRCIYYPYLGRNDHPADITRVQVEEAVENDFSVGQLDCLVPKNLVKFVELDEDEEEELELGMFREFKYEEALPCGMDAWTNHYIMKTYVYTNMFVRVQDEVVYELKDGKKILFV
ncbi:MAG: type I-B CRISPR-associated protein Cas5b [Eubacteriales bacterium]|nr:type I-B CRISPR-associated protein Cas5b [Eubacteriales bacterium]